MLAADIEMRAVTIARQDGSGGRDPANTHPEGKVPFLTDGDEAVCERGAIMLYLTDAYSAIGLGPLPGEADRGPYLSWLFYYQGIIEPLLILKRADVSHPAITAGLRDFDTMIERLAERLRRGPWLLGERFSAADMLCSSPFFWFADMMPAAPAIRDWVTRCGERMGGDGKYHHVGPDARCRPPHRGRVQDAVYGAADHQPLAILRTFLHRSLCNSSTRELFVNV